MSESDRLSGILKETAGLFVISVVASSVLLSRRHTRKAAAQKLNSTSSGPIIMSAFGNSFLASVGSFITAGAYFRMRAGEITKHDVRAVLKKFAPETISELEKEENRENSDVIDNKEVTSDEIIVQAQDPEQRQMLQKLVLELTEAGLGRSDIEAISRMQTVEDAVEYLDQLSK